MDSSRVAVERDTIGTMGVSAPIDIIRGRTAEAAGVAQSGVQHGMSSSCGIAGVPGPIEQSATGIGTGDADAEPPNSDRAMRMARISRMGDRLSRLRPWNNHVTRPTNFVRDPCQRQ